MEKFKVVVTFSHPSTSRVLSRNRFYICGHFPKFLPKLLSWHPLLLFSIEITHFFQSRLLLTSYHQTHVYSTLSFFSPFYFFFEYVSPPPFNFHFTPYLLHHILKTFFFHPTIKDPKQFESQLIVESLSKIKQQSNIFLLRIYWVQPNLISNHSKETKTLSVLLLANPFGLYHEKFLPTKEASTSSICSIKLLNSSLSLRHNIPSPTPSLSKGLLT